MTTTRRNQDKTDLAVRLVLYVAKVEGITPQAVLRAIAKPARGHRKGGGK